MTCKEFEAALGALLNGRALPDRPEGEGEHLSDCASCRARTAGMWRLQEALFRLGGSPPELGERIRQSVRTVEDGLRQPEARRVEAVRRRIVRVASARTRRRRILVAAVAAAVVVATVMIVVRHEEPPRADTAHVLTASTDSSTRRQPETQLPVPNLIPAEPPSLPPSLAPEKRGMAQAQEPSGSAAGAARQTELVPEAPPHEPTPQAPPRSSQTKAPTLPRAEVVLRRGLVSAFLEGTWVIGGSPVEGIPLRAEGPVRLECAGSFLELEGQTEFAVSKNEFALRHGGLGARLPPGSSFTLLLGPCRIVRRAGPGLVLLSARPDMVVVEEGVARAGRLALLEGVEYRLQRGTLVPQARRAPPVAARLDGVVVWSAAPLEEAEPPGHTPPLVQIPGLAADPRPPSRVNVLGLIHSAPANGDLFALGRATALRFRYLLKRPAPLRVLLFNATQKANFLLDVDPVMGHWTTVTVPVGEIPPDPRGRKASAEVGDAYRDIRFLGANSSDLSIERLEVVEIEK